MLIPNHPEEELLAAYADAEPEALGDARVSQHLATCERCTTLVADLRGLTAALAALPDLEPSRPLRLLPPAEPARPSLADRVGGVIRGIFAPALTAGAALALVGAVGTAAPAFTGAAGGADSGPAALEFGGENADQAAEPTAPAAAETERSSAETDSATSAGGDGEESAAPGYVAADTPGADETPVDAEQFDQTPAPDEARDLSAAATDDRPIWPMLLFTGVALIIAALLLRWIFVPRAG